MNSAYIAGLAGLLAAGMAQGQGPLTFKKIVVTSEFVGEGVTVGDFNRDGKADIAAGVFLWYGPDFQERRKYGDGQETFDGSRTWAYYGMNLPTLDVNNDAWPDIVVTTGVGGQVFWKENPKNTGTGSWAQRQIVPYVGFESNNLYPLLKNGSLQLLYANQDKKVGYGTPNPSDPHKPWIFHLIGNPSPPGSFYKGYVLNSHGLGMGDINGDGRNDVMVSDAWFEQPASLAGDPLWIRHDYDFSLKKAFPEITATNDVWGGAQMYASDLDGDGDADVVSSLDGHGWGLAWFEQVEASGGGITFKPHIIMGSRAQEARYGVAFSQLHSLGFADLDGDGLKDIVTGKRYWAHLTTGDPEPMGAAVLYAFVQTRGPGGTVFKPVLIDSSAGAGCRLEATLDMNGDGYPDVVVGSKKGIHAFLSVDRPPVTTLSATGNAGARPWAWRLGVRLPGIIPPGTPGLTLPEAGDGSWDVLGVSRRGTRSAGAYLYRP